MEDPAWLTADIELVNGRICEVVNETYKLKNEINFISKNKHPNYIQLAQKACLQCITRKGVDVLGMGFKFCFRFCSQNPIFYFEFSYILSRKMK